MFKQSTQVSGLVTEICFAYVLAVLFLFIDSYVCLLLISKFIYLFSFLFLEDSCFSVSLKAVKACLEEFLFSRVWGCYHNVFIQLLYHFRVLWESSSYRRVEHHKFPVSITFLPFFAWWILGKIQKMSSR